MAKDTQRDKARATFGKTFFENSKAQANPKNSMAALQARANARPIPTFKVGGVVKKADGGKAKAVMADRLKARIDAGNYKDGGKAESRYERKMKDIEKDFRIAMAKGKDADVAKAKMNQRIADAKDDLAKATKQDRTATKAAEKAAERELTMTRRYGAAKPAESMKDKPLATPKGPSDAEMAGISALKPVAKPAPAKAAAPKGAPRAQQLPPRMQGRAPVAQRNAAPAAAPRAAAPVTRESAFAALQEKSKPTEIKTPGQAPRLLSAATKGGTPSSGDAYQQKRTAKLEAMRMAAEAPGASTYAKDRYRMAKETGMYSKGGKVGKYAAGGAGKVRKGMMKGK